MLKKRNLYGSLPFNKTKLSLSYEIICRLGGSESTSGIDGLRRTFESGNFSTRNKAISNHQSRQYQHIHLKNEPRREKTEHLGER